MKKIIGIIVIVLLIPVVIVTISDIDRTPIYPTTEFNLEKLTRISSFDLENGIELPKMPNGVGDRWLSNGTFERKVGKAVIDGSEDWSKYGSDAEPYTTVAFRIAFTGYVFVGIHNEYISNILTSGAVDGTDIPNRISLTYNNQVLVRLAKSDLVSFGYDEGMTDKQKVNVFKQWLVAQKDAGNPLTLYYQLAEPVIETAPSLPDFIDYYDGGSVIVDDGIIDYTVVENLAQINYIEGNITTVTDGQFNISKPTKIISKSNDLYDYDLYDYDLSTLPNYFEYGSLPQGTYENILVFIDDNQNKDVKLYYNDIIHEHRFNTYLENGSVLLSNDTEFITIYENDTYTSTLNLDTDITYKLEGYHIIDYIDGKFDNTVLAFFWVIPALLVGGLIYLLLKRKE